MLLIKSMLLYILMSSIAHAAVVTVSFTGTINGQGGLSSDLHTLIPIGQTFTGSYTYDSSFPATSTIGTNDITYTGAISNFTVNFGSLYATLDNGAVRYINDKEIPLIPPETNPSYYDTYTVQGRTDHSSLPTNVDTNIVLSDYHLRWLRLDVTDLTAVILNSALLTSGIPDITGQNTRFEFGYQLDCCTGTTDVYGNIDSLTISSVPVPAAIWLFVTGIASLVSFTKYNNKKSC